MIKWSKNNPSARLALLGIGAALAVACTDAADLGVSFGSFSAPHDLAMIGLGCNPGEDPSRVGQPCLLFVASSEADELKVLDLTPAVYQWVRAPNPLRPLSIPVLPSPTRLVEDVRYVITTDNALEEKGPFLYASNPGLSEISVVGAGQDQLKELIRLRTPGPVAALSSLGAGTTGSESVLYYAINSDGGGRVYKVILPLAGLDPAAEPTPEQVLDLPGEYISSIAVTPRFGSAPDLAVATRTAQGRSGRTFLAGLGGSPERALNFPFPVRALRADPSTERAGQQIWGLLDEAACGGQPQCSGVLAVRFLDGAIVDDITSYPMLPITHGAGVAVNFDIFPDAALKASNAAGGLPQNSNVLGVVAYATGRIGFFDAKTGLTLDAVPSAPAVSQLYVDAAGNLLETDPGRQSDEFYTSHGPQNATIQLAEGAVRDEQLVVVYQGEVPGLINVALDPAAPVPMTLPVDPALLAPCTVPAGAPAGAADVCPRVHVGDAVVLQGGCTEELTVTAVGTDSFDVSPPTGACSGATGFTLRAGSSRPFVVVGSVSGYLGRTGVDLPFSAYLPYRFHGATYTPVNPLIKTNYAPANPAIQFVVAAPPAGIGRDYRYVLTLRSGFAPMFILFPETTTFNNSYRNTYPGGLAYLQTAASLFVSLPASRTVVQLGTESIDANTTNFGALEYQ